MHALDWTVSFRPLRLLRAPLALATLGATLLAQPTKTSDLPVRPSPAQQAYEHAHDVVGQVLADRMAYLDDGRRQELAHAILRESLRAGFDPLFVLAVIEVESRYDMEAVSPSGARGLMQVLPSTWRDQVERGRLGRLEKFNPSHNVVVGIRYLGSLATSFRRPDTLLLAYNQGPGGASGILASRVEPTDEARQYPPRVLACYRKLLAQLGLGLAPRAAWRAPHLTVLRRPMLAMR